MDIVFELTSIFGTFNKFNFCLELALDRRPQMFGNYDESERLIKNEHQLRAKELADQKGKMNFISVVLNSSLDFN